MKIHACASPPKKGRTHNLPLKAEVDVVPIFFDHPFGSKYLQESATLLATHINISHSPGIWVLCLLFFKKKVLQEAYLAESYVTSMSMRTLLKPLLPVSHIPYLRCITRLFGKGFGSCEIYPIRLHARPITISLFSLLFKNRTPFSKDSEQQKLDETSADRQLPLLCH